MIANVKPMGDGLVTGTAGLAVQWMERREFFTIFKLRHARKQADRPVGEGRSNRGQFKPKIERRRIIRDREKRIKSGF